MTAHSAFIAAAYGVTFCVIAGLIIAVLMDHRALGKALAKWPDRDDPASRRES